jgi:predicted membrane chloride channel (bestrophin family)
LYTTKVGRSAGKVGQTALGRTRAPAAAMVMHMDAILERTFFEYIFFASFSSLPIALWNSLLIAPAPLLAYGLHWYFGFSADPTLLTPLSVLVGLMLSARINEAYGKYRRAYDIFNKLDLRVSQCIQRLIAYTPRPRRDESEVVSLRETLRRHLLLACCLMMQSLRDHKYLDELRLFPGLLTAEEVKHT